MAKVKPVTKTPFNPEGAYQWDPADEFTLNGQQFLMVFNIFKELTQSRQPVPARFLVDTYNELTGILKTGFEQGVVKEFVPANQQPAEVNS